jgi:putative ABC transport system permease protein
MEPLKGFSSALFGMALRLLPRWLRQDVGREMQLTFDDRLRECDTGMQVVRASALELSGVLVVAVRARLFLSALPGVEQTRRDGVLSDVRQDVVYAFRAFARRPVFTLMVIATFALGVGATSAMISVVDAVLLRPLPYPDPERVVIVYPTLPDWKSIPTLQDSWASARFSPPEFAEFKARQRSYSALGAYKRDRASLVGYGEPEIVPIGRGTAGLFGALGVRPLHGRLLAADESAPVGMLQYDFWQSRFGGDPAIVGQKIQLGKESVEVVGVLPERFEVLGLEAKVWLPVTETMSEQERNNHVWRAIGRLRDGVSVDAADDEANRIIASFSVGDHIKHGGRIVSPLEDVTAKYRLPLYVLVGASFLLLLTACISVAAMLLGLGMDRGSEIAVRAALGASRRRVLSQLLTEGLLLGVLGSAVGILLAFTLQRFLLQLAPADLPRLAEAGVNARVLGFTLFASLGSAIVFAVVPALTLSRANLGATAVTLRVTRHAHGRLQQGLVVAEIALATVLLMSAGLLTRTMQHFNAVDPGFDPDAVITVRITPDADRFDFPRDGYEARVRAYYDRLQEQLSSIPGVESIAVTSAMPFTGDRASNDVEPEGYTRAPGEVLDAWRRRVSASYFDVMRMRLVDGRFFSAAEDQPGAQPVVVINERMARRFWPGQRAVGKRIGRIWTGGRSNQHLVIGVVRDAREHDLRGEESITYYAPNGRESGGSFVLRTRLSVNELAPVIRHRLWSVDPTLPITGIASMRELMGQSVSAQRYRMRLVVAFSILATLFALMGAYGVLSRAAARREREMGIRAAVGALYTDLALLMLKQGLALVLIGLTAGLAAAWFATRALETMLFETRRTDPLTIGGIVLLMTVIGLTAGWYPARRAARVDPMRVLRSD